MGRRPTISAWGTRQMYSTELPHSLPARRLETVAHGSLRSHPTHQAARRERHAQSASASASAGHRPSGLAPGRGLARRPRAAPPPSAPTRSRPRLDACRQRPSLSQLLRIEESGDAAREVVHVVGFRVERGVSCRNARLAQVVRHDGSGERHVLDDLVHRREVVQRILRVGREADVGRREDADDIVVGNPPGERPPRRTGSAPPRARASARARLRHR